MYHLPLVDRKMRSRLNPRIPSLPIANADDAKMAGTFGEPVMVKLNNPYAAPQPQVATYTAVTTMVVYETQTIAAGGKVNFGQPTLASANPFVGQTLQTAAAAPLQDQQGITPASPIPSTGDYIEEKHPISSTTKHLLIAAGSIAITLIVAFIAFIIWRRKMKAKTGLLRPVSTSYEKPADVSAPLGSNWGYGMKSSWENKSGYTMTTSTAYKDSNLSVDKPYAPDAAFMRPGTSNSNRAAPTRAPFPPPNRPRSNTEPVVPSPVAMLPRSPQPPQQQNPFTTNPSSPAGQAQGFANRNVAENVLATSDPTPKQSRFSWTNSQAPRTPFDSSRFAPLEAPRLPFAPGQEERLSTVSIAESVPRYRTVESWVGVQAGKYEEARMNDRIQKQLDETIASLSEVGMSPPDPTATATRPTRSSSLKSPSRAEYIPGLRADAGTPVPMPEMPAKFQDAAERLRVAMKEQETLEEKRDAVAELPTTPVAPQRKMSTSGAVRAPPSPHPGQRIPSGQIYMGPVNTEQLPQPPPLPVQQQIMRTMARPLTNMSDAPIFQVHPGTKVEIPSDKFIPSVILDSRMVPRQGYERRDSYGEVMPMGR